MILNNIYKIKESIDVYVIDDIFIKFYYINTRKELKIKVSQDIVEFISSLDGKKTLKECLSEDLENYTEFEEFILFLEKQNILEQIIISENTIDIDEERYQRQITFFDDLVLPQTGKETQILLKNQHIVIFGVGSVGSAICIELARMGVEKFTIIDHDNLKQSDKTRHWFYSSEYLGKAKVYGLKKFLLKINSKIEIHTHQDTITPNTNLENYFTDNNTFVVNTMSTPYILYTSLKIETETIKRKLPLYIAGGFDGHLGSTGELIYPPLTPCVRCYMNLFSKSLKDWKPEYNTSVIEKEQMLNNNFETGGLVGLSLFSATFAVTQIVKYIFGIYELLGRGEYSFEDGKISFLQIKKDNSCEICGEQKYAK